MLLKFESYTILDNTKTLFQLQNQLLPFVSYVILDITKTRGVPYEPDNYLRVCCFKNHHCQIYLAISHQAFESYVNSSQGENVVTKKLRIVSAFCFILVRALLNLGLNFLVLAGLDIFLVGFALKHYFLLLYRYLQVHLLSLLGLLKGVS